MMQPLITVVIPTYNRADKLKRLISTDAELREG